MKTIKKNTESTICGKTIWLDNSGVGHNYRIVSAAEISPDHREAIAAEILDGKREEGEEIIGGQHYRWA